MFLQLKNLKSSLPKEVLSKSSHTWLNTSLEDENLINKQIDSETDRWWTTGEHKGSLELETQVR